MITGDREGVQSEHVWFDSITSLEIIITTYGFKIMKTLTFVKC